MADKPILFSGPMIRALLDGSKTQTRRVIKPQPKSMGGTSYGEAWSWQFPGKGFAGVTADQIRKHGHKSHMGKYAVGDRLWVREAWRTAREFDHIKPSQLPQKFPLKFEASHDWHRSREWTGKLRPSIFMLRRSSRLTLIVTDIRIERVQDISEDDAREEGASLGAREWFSILWDSINAKCGFGWDDNPWVVAYTFTVHKCNIDKMGD